jgi:flagellar assembly protein FliH
MSAPAKFMFDIDFGAPKPANTVLLSEHEAKVGEAETRGYRNGFTAGQQEAAAESARRLAIAMESVARFAVDPDARAFGGRVPGRERKRWRLRSRPDASCAETLIAREPLRRDRGAGRRTASRDLVTTPHLSWCASMTRFTNWRRKNSTAIARQTGFEGRLVIMAEPDIAVGDCRIEWADGGVMRDRRGRGRSDRRTVKRFVEASPRGRACGD